MPSKSAARALRIVALLVLTLPHLGCDKAEPEADPLGRIDSVVLITIDTLRADHLSCYGYPRMTTPFVDSLATAGWLFENAFAPIATTAPSHASLFTSLYPSQHGVRKNGQILDERFVTLAENLSDAGVSTAAFASTRRHFGVGRLMQGFGVWNEPADSPMAKLYRPAGATVEQALAWARGHDSKAPYLLWVHVFDPHSPFDSRNRWVDEDPRARDDLAAFLQSTQRVPLDFFGGDTANMMELMDLYDGEILSVDRQLRRLHAGLQDAGLLDKSLWIVTSDHGEGLGNHHWAMHGKMIYNEQLRVPLIVYAPGAGLDPADGGDGSAPRTATNGRRRSAVVELTDLAPTLYQILGVDPIPTEPPLQGRSMLPLLRASPSWPLHETAFAERRFFEAPSEQNPITPAYEAGEKYALQNDAFKLLYRTEGPSEFYDLRVDPYETNDLAGGGLPEEEALQTLLLGELERLRSGGAVEADLVDPETIEALKALGYVE